MGDDQTAEGQWAALWETYMHENRALRARAEAAEARAAQAEADARLMLIELNGLDSSEGTGVFDCLSDAGLTRAEWDAVDRLPRPSGSDEDWADMLAAVRRILAAGGAA